MSGFLIDTNVISELVKPRPDPRVARWVETVDEDLLYLSVLTLGEIRKGIASQSDPGRRTLLENWLQGLLIRFTGRILPVDQAVADRWGQITGSAKSPLPVVDSLLAATALHHNLNLVTRDTRAVATTGAAILNPWEL